jgi:DNA-binding transcriptional ArsR family regulator
MRDRPHTAPADVDLPQLMHAFSDPQRLRIVEVLDRLGETPCACIYPHIGLSRSNASHHFRVLREAGVVHSRTAGRDQFVRLRDAELAEHFPGLLEALLVAFRRRHPCPDNKETP